MVTDEHRKELLNYIQSDPETYTAFKALTNLTAKYQLKYRGQLCKARKFLLNGMLNRGCRNNLERIQQFIQYNYTQLELMGDETKPLHGYNGVRI